LDKATLSVDLGLGSRLRLFNKAIRDQALQDDLRQAVDMIRTRGLREGHPQVIDLLWPTGTTARSDIEALVALRQQVPELADELRTQLQEQPPDLLSTPSVDTLPDPAKAVSSVVKLVTDRSKQKALAEEVKDLARKTPKGLETPPYTVIRTLEGPIFLGAPEPIELRRYSEFTVARTAMSGSGFGGTAGGEGFNTLASYLFGENELNASMAMTMPVEVTGSSATSAAGSMAFVLPKKNAGVPPAPLETSGVTIDTVPERLVAAKAFGGVVTDAEVQRQRAKLLEAIAKDPSLVPSDSFSVLQYNSPLTIPWRRRNEVAIVVTEVAETTAPAEAASVVSWYDAGVRL